MYLDWKRSSGWLESWEGLLSVTDVSTTCAEAILTLMVASAQVIKMSVTKGLITWAGLARLAGLLRCAQMTFSPVLHRVSQPGWWLMRWTSFGAKKELYFQNRHYKNAANDRNCLFSAAGCITLPHSCSYMDLYFCFFYIERGILISLCAEEKFIC